MATKKSFFSSFSRGNEQNETADVYTKGVPTISPILEKTRGGLNKSFIPRFLYKPPFGYPRFIDIAKIKRLAASPYVEMCISTIINKIASYEWEIINKDPQQEGNDKLKDNIRNFLNNPNTNKESFEHVFVRTLVRDILELDSAVQNKIFNLKGEMVEVVTRDGSSFTKNPDIHGMMTFRKDLLIPTTIVDDMDPLIHNHFEHITSMNARERAAYFQYGWNVGPAPIPFGRREIVWYELNPRTDDVYGRSPIQILAESLQMLIYAVQADLEYFNDNNLPKGVLGFDGADSAELKSFREQWNTQLYSRDVFGELKRKLHKVPITNKVPVFTRMEFTAAEMQIIEKQKWYSKMVWACFGVTPAELGYTEDAKGQANQIVQSQVFKERAINPILRHIANRINTEIIPEFETDEVIFHWKIFDVDEERKRYELYNLQVNGGMKTVNEIREMEGDNPVDWGDEPPRNWQTPETGFFSNTGALELTNQQEKKSIESKPFAGYSSFDACVAANKDKKNPAAYCAEIMRRTEEKAIGADNPLLLKEGERPGPKRLSRALKYGLREAEKRLISVVKSEMSEKTLSEIKGLADVARKLSEILRIDAFKRIIDAVISTTFTRGWNESEKALDMNVPFNRDAVSFLQQHTFDNIKDMSEEVANDLRQVLQRGIIDGKGASELTKNIKSVFDVAENRAEAIARTETNRANNQGRLLAMKGSGREVKKWVLVTHDDRTSTISKAIDSKYGSPEKAIPVNAMFSVTVSGKDVSAQSPPFHVNERDRLMFVLQEN